MDHRLRNHEDRRRLKAKLQTDATARTTVSFYRYFRVEEPEVFRDELYAAWMELGVLGRTYVAREGINAQISVPTERFGAFRDHLYGLPGFDGVRLNVAVDDGKSFFRLAIKVREKIVADGLDDASFDASNTGIHLTAKDFNVLTADPETILIDMRNRYESEVGHFRGAITPEVNTFREEIALVEQLLEGKEDRPIVMSCTGGIRCEKASAYLKHRGFRNVHQLDGGIISYARQVSEQGLENRYIGKNFVFDERLSERITDDIVAHCHQCGAPADTHVNCVNLACNLLFIQCTACAEAYEGTCSPACKDIIHLPEEEQQEIRRQVGEERNRRRAAGDSGTQGLRYSTAPSRT